MVLKQQKYSLTKKRSIHQMMDHKSLGSSFCTDEVMMIREDDENETLGLHQKKKPRSVPWWDESDAFNELDSVVKGRLPELKDAASVVGSSSLPKIKAKKYERALSLIQRGNFFDLCDDESHSGGNNKTNQDPFLGRYKNKENISHMDNCFTFCSINDLIKSTKKGNERSLSSRHHDNNFTDMCEDESSGGSNKGNQHDLSEDMIIGESFGSNSNGNRHVSLEDLGVGVEDLKSMPWETFDPTWEIN
ncbi:hypothetical protein Bca52824_015058 [Brassica carinata]|uniref:Uncharacterized protein n=1 Tax=Brassica carinata TaxID=52824 RepID=A0A8X7W3Q2_BRACI|nr:hypothetical protein Bca52824_015058 [Brassica carinata]